MREYLRERPAMAIEIENRVREKLGVALRVGGVPAGKPAKASKAAAGAAPAAVEAPVEDEL